MKSKVNYRTGAVVDRNGKNISNQHDAWAEDAKCGCGIDCCKRELVLTDKVTGEAHTIFFREGELFVSINGREQQISGSAGGEKED